MYVMDVLDVFDHLKSYKIDPSHTFEEHVMYWKLWTFYIMSHVSWNFFVIHGKRKERR